MITHNPGAALSNLPRPWAVNGYLPVCTQDICGWCLLLCWHFEFDEFVYLQISIPLYLWFVEISDCSLRGINCIHYRWLRLISWTCCHHGVSRWKPPLGQCLVRQAELPGLIVRSDMAYERVMFFKWWVWYYDINGTEGSEPCQRGYCHGQTCRALMSNSIFAIKPWNLVRHFWEFLMTVAKICNSGSFLTDVCSAMYALSLRSSSWMELCSGISSFFPL